MTPPSCVLTSSAPAPKKDGAQAIGRSRGRLTTNIHALVDAVGNPVEVMLSTMVSNSISSTLIPEQEGDQDFEADQVHFDAPSEYSLRSSFSSIPDVFTAAPFDNDVHHHGFRLKQLMAV